MSFPLRNFWWRASNESREGDGHSEIPSNAANESRRVASPTGCMFNAAMHIRGALPVRYQFRSRTTLLVLSPSCALSASSVVLLVAERLLSRKGLGAHSACGCRDDRVAHGDADGIRITRCYRTRVSSMDWRYFLLDEMEKQIWNADVIISWKKKNKKNLCTFLYNLYLYTEEKK